MGRPKGSKNKAKEPKIKATGGSEGRNKYLITYMVHDLQAPYEVTVNNIFQMQTLSIVKVCKWLLTWVVRLTILVPLLFLKQIFEWAEYQFDNIEEWLELWNNP
jgi:hypothetical protein